VALRHGRERTQPTRRSESYAALVLLVLCACATQAKVDAPSAAPVVILPREPEQLDPRYVGDAYGLKVTRLLHASLVRVDPFTLEPVPELAEEIQVESPVRYRVRLRPGLAFSDGTALDAQDVVATFRALVDPKVKSRFVSTFARIRSVQAETAREVVFELDAPHATFLTDLEMPVLRSEDAYIPAQAGRLPLGAGAYRLAERETGTLILRENRHYHAGPIAHPELKLIVIHDDNTRALRMLAGGGDLALNTIPPLLLPLFDRPGFRVQSEHGAGTTYIGVNLAFPALADRRVRQAIAHAIDRASLVRHKLFGRAALASSWIAPAHWAYTSDTPRYDFDLERARALMREARPDAEPLALTLRTSSDRAVISMARAIASMLREIGIDLDVRPSEGATLLADLARGRFQLSLLQSPEVVEPHVLSWFFASERIPLPGKREGANRWRIHNAALDAALERGRATVERSARVEAYHEVQRLLASELPVIPLWHEDVVAVTSERLSDFRVPRDARFGTLALRRGP
jgi:peptide/nickel transport system substrate-binding protein